MRQDTCPETHEELLARDGRGMDSVLLEYNLEEISFQINRRAGLREDHLLLQHHEQDSQEDLSADLSGKICFRARSFKLHEPSSDGRISPN